MRFRFLHKADPRVVYYQFWGLPDKSVPYGYVTPHANPYIFIQKGLTQWEKEIVYVHERQHVVCANNKCFCWQQDSDFWTEYHACRAEFMYVLDNHHPKLCATYIGMLSKFLRGHPRKKEVEICALRRLLRMHVFQGFLDTWDVLDLVRTAVEPT